MEANQGGGIGKARGVEPIQQLHYPSGLVTGEAVAAVLKFRELMFDNAQVHGD